MTPSEHFWRTGGKTCSPTTAICPHLHLLLAAFNSLLMRSSQPYLNASRSPLLPTAAADAEERRALRFNRRVKKTLSSSLPPSPFHKAAPPSLLPQASPSNHNPPTASSMQQTPMQARLQTFIQRRRRRWKELIRDLVQLSDRLRWERKDSTNVCVSIHSHWYQSFPLRIPFHRFIPHVPTKFHTSQMHPVTGDLRVTQSGGFLSVLRQRCGELRSVNQQVNRCTVDPHDYSGSDVIKGRISCVSCWRVMLFSTSHYKCITDCLMILAWCYWRPQQGWDKKKKKDKRLKSSKTALKNKQTNKKKPLKDILEVTSEVYPTIT